MKGHIYETVYQAYDAVTDKDIEIPICYWDDGNWEPENEETDSQIIDRHSMKIFEFVAELLVGRQEAVVEAYWDNKAMVARGE